MTSAYSTSAPAVQRTAIPYAPPRLGVPVNLHLSSNEGPASVGIGELAGMCDPDAVRRYPSAAGLEHAIADRWNLTPDRVVITAGADEAIDRACRAWLGQGRELILPVPTFEMIGRYARLAGAEVATTNWSEGPYPVEAVLDRVSDRTAMIAVVSPNNPTGAVAAMEDLNRLAAAAPQAMLLVDCAYGEFADDDLSAGALTLPNAIVIRTFSKAFGLAGMRVGYALGSAENVGAMRAAGSPYPVSGVSLAAAGAALARERATLPAVVARVRDERDRLFDLLTELGARPRRSQGNFVLADFADPEWVWRALGALGIGVRRLAEGQGLERSLRISCPGGAVDFERLRHALRAALRPRALLLDMDGVIADVSGSYRRAIALTVESFGALATPREIGAAKAEGDANNDWVLTQRLLARGGVEASLAEITRRFEALYRGDGVTPGLEASERLIPDREVLERLAARLPLAIVTGRPRRDCDQFLSRFGLEPLFKAVVCMEDAPVKPDPAPVRLALQRLGVDAAWMVGDTPDDIVAAGAAGVIPIGIAPPGGDNEGLVGSMRTAGAARILGALSELEVLLP